MKKDLQQLLRRFRKRKGKVASSGGHYKLTHDSRPGIVVTVPSTPSCYRSVANARASIKRYLGITL